MLNVIKYYTHLSHIILISDILIAKLLGRPQLQMYPPVALNQYTGVNVTHKHILYICFKAPLTPKIDLIH